MRPTPGSQPSLPGPARLCPLCFQPHQPPIASHPARAPGAPDLSLDPVITLELRSSVRCLVVHAPGSRTQSAVSRVQVRGPPAPQCWWLASHQPPRMRSRSSRSPSSVSSVWVRSPSGPPCRWLLLPSALTRWLVPPSVYLPITVPRYSVLEMFICRDPDVSSCVSG